MDRMMTGRVFITILFCAGLFCAGLARAAEPVGLLSLVSGDVRILRAGQAEEVPARIADLIGGGDRVLTGSDAQAMFLFCPDPIAGTLLQNGEIEFTADGFTVRSGEVRNAHDIPGCRLPATLALSDASSIQTGSLRLRGYNVLLRAPSRTMVATLRPEFRWDPVENATRYELRLMDREERILWRATTESSSIEYPTDAYGLEWDTKYWWRITARQYDEAINEVGSFFEVLPEEQALRVQSAEASLLALREANPADNAPLFLLAFLYEENEMLDEAALIYGELSEEMASQDWVVSRLNDLMGKLGWDRLESGPPQ